jgi:hypothetical protein
MAISTVLAGLAVFAVSFEMTWTAVACGALAFCLIGHGV